MTAASTKDVPAISVQGLVKSFGPIEVLKHINLDIYPGEVVCVIGPSGSGKSTLLRCVNLLETPTGGKIFVGDDEMTDPDVRHRQGPPAHRHGVPDVQPLPAPHRAAAI